MTSQIDMEHVLALLVFGSVARGDQGHGSDLDLLVVVDGEPARRSVQEAIRLHDARMSPLVLTPDGLEREVCVHPSFVAHLLDEGVLVAGGSAWDGLSKAMELASVDAEALAEEARSRGRDLAPLRIVGRFENSPVTLLSHLYSVSRSLVIIRLLQSGVREYGWQRVFDRYGEVRPDLCADLSSLKALRPYYDYARARPEATLPTRRVSPDELDRLVHSALLLTA